jgi:hypothetical protein
VDVSFLIDPLRETVTGVPDGFARAAELIGSDTVSGSTLWSIASDPDTSVQVIVADESFTDDPIARGFFLVSLNIDGDPQERVFAGKAVLNAYGALPDDIKEQVKTLKAAREHVRFLTTEEALRWFDLNTGQAPFDLDDSGGG